MSGPKISVYSLSEAAIALLLAERERRLKKRMQNQKFHDDLKLKINSIGDIEKRLSGLNKLADRVSHFDNDQSFIDNIENAEKLVKQYRIKLDDLLSRESNEDSLKELKLVSESIEELNRHVIAYEQNRTGYEEKLKTTLDHDIAGLFKDKADSKDSDDVDTISKIKSDASVYLNDSSMDVELKTKLGDMLEKLDGYEDEHEMSAFISLKIIPCLDECRDYLSAWKKHGDEYQNLLVEYKAVSEELGVTLKENISFSLDNLEMLRNKIAIMKLELQKRDEHEYVYDALSEVMDEMGYDMLALRNHDTKSGEHYHNELYDFQGDTALSITYRDNGQVALELGKVDNCNRSPDMEESVHQKDMMEVFCCKFKEIEKRLADKGVVLGKRLFMAPPATEFAQILNLNDFEICKRKSSEQNRKRNFKGQESIHKEL